MVLWIFLGLLSAFFDATRLALSKRIVSASDEFVVAVIPKLLMIPFFILWLLFVPMPELKPIFWVVVAIVVITATVLNILIIYAIKVSPLSATVPFASFSPIFLLIWSPIILKENPGLMGVIGVILGLVGVYVLNISQSKEGLLEPFKAILKEKGSLIMLITAFVFGITLTIEKIGILNSDPIFYLIVTQIGIALLSIPVMLYKSKDYKLKIKKDWKALFVIGIITTLALVAQFTAVKTALVPYVISLKRVAALFGVIYGGVMFKEQRIKERIIGTIIIVSGVILIAFD